MKIQILLLINSFLILLEHALAWSWNPACLVTECCNSDSIPADLRGLSRALNNHVYGQHIAIDILLNALQDHLKEENPKKALTLSLHGWPGIGKNYVVEFIINNLYKKGEQSLFVNQFMAQLHFPEHNLAGNYAIKLFETIKKKLAKCPRQIFIFNEIDKMPAGVLNGISPVLDSHKFIDGIEFRKAIYIFITNTGGDMIANRLSELTSQGLNREEIQLYHFEHLIRSGAYNEKGGLQNSDSISNNLIDHYIPFLPLERKHVEKCIVTEFNGRNFLDSQDLIDEVMEYVTFGSNGNELFATTGCKRIYQKVGTIVQRERSKKLKFEL